MKTLTELQAEKRRLARLLTRALENHNDVAVAANARKIRSLNLEILQAEQNHTTRT